MRKRIFVPLFFLSLFCMGLLAILSIVEEPSFAAGQQGFLQDPKHRFLIYTGGLFGALCLVMGTLFVRATGPIKKMLQVLDSQGAVGIKRDALYLAKDEFGRLARMIHDLTAQLSEQKEALSHIDAEKETLLESLDEGAILLDRHLRVKMCNRIASKTVKVPKDDLQGKTLHQLAERIPSPIWKKSYDLVRKALETQSVMAGTIHFESPIKSHLSLRATPLPQGMGVVLVLQDTSSQYKVVEMGRDFIANASHELRTPITIIKGFAETLRDVPEISGAMLEDITEKIVRNCQRMNNLVKNLLLLADLDSFSKLRLQACDLVALIDNCNQTVLSLSPETIIETLYNKKEIMISADPDLLELALSNLLQNAVKYSQNDPEIQITIEEKETEVLLMITDKGIGIPAKDLPHIFDRFYTVDKAHSRRMGGAGLGLSIVKRIIEKHEGAVHASSTLGQGTTFTLVFPKPH